ncbi:MAG: sorbosone dehydrogenase family protein [Anaerolineae bacterium]
MNKIKIRYLNVSSMVIACLLGTLMLTSCQSESIEPVATDDSPATKTAVPPPTKTPEPQPQLLRDDISIRKLTEIGGGGIKLALNPNTRFLYFLRPGEGIFQITLGGSTVTTKKIVPIEKITPDGWIAGMKFGPDGTLYAVVNRRPNESETMTQASIYKGTISNAGDSTWETLATTDPYPASNTNFDHLFNGITISPDNQWVYLNSGSRTDHGEVEDTEGEFPNLREVPLTSAILRIPADGVDLIIPNDEAALNELGYLYADGTRNAYDLEFAPNGDLFGIDNGPDADYSEEINWIREGHHYGFPWRFGDQDNPQQFADYDPSQDKRLDEDFVAVQMGTYQNDPDFPPPPQEFTDPIINLGPAATQYKDDNGRPQIGETLSTLTAHRSPLGLVFLNDAELPDWLASSADELSLFVVSWGAAAGDLSDQGNDLLHMKLTKNGDNYEAVTSQIATEFRRPIDAVIIENRLYVLEWDGAGAIWELTFE